ncbi:SseB family protein [Stenotrophomonas pigmentata]|uniref:SseB family protein n=1 Tax=Stenotrophomonas pigmentata TaxID=3055080 RepID=UPI0026ED3F8A|nr:SseB family protein [Stenotrophomonas sp. 610A2]
MIWSLFAKKKANETPSIVDAVELLSMDPSARSRNAFYDSLKTAQLFIASRDVSQSWEEGPLTLQQAAAIPVLTTSSPDGGEALLAFTSHAEALRRTPTVCTFSMEAKDVLYLVLENNLSGLIVNPAGPWAGVPTADIHAILGHPLAGL